jgi:simple sugar transport system permease protein
MSMDLDILASFLGAALRMSAPLLAACLAGLWSERAGIVDVGLEGKMLAAAFAGATAAGLTGHAGIGLLAAIAAATVLALLHGYISINRGGNQIVSGMAINMIAAGATALAGAAIFGEGGRTPALAGAARLGTLGAGASLLTLTAFAAVPVTALLLRETRFGLHITAAGENPHALAAAGVSVRRVRYAAMLACGLLCGIAGADLSLAQAAGFLPGMTAGKGFIALAALVLAKWRPLGALAACLSFGMLDAAAIRLQGAAIPGLPQIPVQLIQALPYMLTLVLLAGFVGRSNPPAAAGVPYRET